MDQDKDKDHALASLQLYEWLNGLGSGDGGLIFCCFLLFFVVFYVWCREILIIYVAINIIILLPTFINMNFHLLIAHGTCERQDPRPRSSKKKNNYFKWIVDEPQLQVVLCGVPYVEYFLCKVAE